MDKKVDKKVDKVDKVDRDFALITSKRWIRWIRRWIRRIEISRKRWMRRGIRRWTRWIRRWIGGG